LALVDMIRLAAAAASGFAKNFVFWDLRNVFWDFGRETSTDIRDTTYFSFVSEKQFVRISN
jgi:hypothetical protein